MNAGFDLSYCQLYIEQVFPNLIRPHTPLKQSYTDIIAILEEYIYLMGGIMNAIGILEVAIDSQSIYNEWIA
jgi:hypothetical protein